MNPWLFGAAFFALPVIPKALPTGTRMALALRLVSGPKVDKVITQKDDLGHLISVKWVCQSLAVKINGVFDQLMVLDTDDRIIAFYTTASQPHTIIFRWYMPVIGFIIWWALFFALVAIDRLTR